MKRIFWLFLTGLLAVPGFAQTIKQSTATTVNIHLRSATTGADVTGATITGITLRIKKHSDTLSATVTSVTAAASGSANDCIEVAAGLYNCELSAANVDTLGLITIEASYTGASSDPVNYEVVAAAGLDCNRNGNCTDGAALLAAVAAAQSSLNTIVTSMPADLVLIKTTIATLASQTSFTLTAGSTDNTAYRSLLVVITDQSTATQKAVGIVSAYTGSTRTVTLLADPGVFTMAVGDIVTILAIRAGI